jgi:hypothetical protein
MPFQYLKDLPVPFLRRMERSEHEPAATQAELLRDLLRRAADTEWGRRFGFAEIAAADSVTDVYRERMPLHSYEDFRADVQRIRKGEENIIWPGRFRHFAVSSGTASAGKIIPVSHEMLTFNRGFAVGVVFNYLVQTGNTRVLRGKHLTLPGRIEEDPNYPGTWVGEVSGLQAEYAPAYFRLLYQAVPNKMAFLPNWERKLEAMAERTMDMDVRMLVMAPTWALVFFRLLVERYNRKHGTSHMEVKDIWPNLQLFISGGVPLSSYRELLEAQIGLPGLHFLETYGASEGFFSFQSSLGDPSMLLHLDNGVYFEFVRLEELGKPGARRYTISEVEIGVRYAPFITTCSGLWAYGVGDVLRFTSTFPHKIVVAGRTNEMIDKYGEAVFGEEARAALQYACEQSGALVLDFHVAPRTATLDTLPSHQWLIEFERAPQNLDAFAQSIDEHLQAVNRHYQIRREAQAFARPEIVPVPQGVFYEWLRQTKKKISGQTKVPRMSEERTVADSVLSLIGNNF